ncbi:hypothetical protein AUJ14_00285 [Candidatus Micrarchaeota archaeon CG1_02_55_22]|nr:MAG: hypothetical protein AUJ14_00285 [Candidatus Micrarchaeota archaeon CG1_02_55_22]
MAKLIFLAGEHPNERNAVHRRIRQITPILNELGHEVVMEDVRARRPREDNFSPNYLFARLSRAQNRDEAFKILEAASAHNRPPSFMYSYLNELTENRRFLEEAAERHPGAHVFSFHATERPLDSYGAKMLAQPVVSVFDYGSEVDIRRSDRSAFIFAKDTPNVRALVEVFAPYVHHPVREYHSKTAPVKDRRDAAARVEGWLRDWAELRGNLPDAARLIEEYAHGHARIPPGTWYDRPEHAQALAQKIHELVTSAEASQRKHSGRLGK